MNKIIRDAITDFHEQLDIQIEDGNEVEVLHYLYNAIKEVSLLKQEEQDEDHYLYHVEYENELLASQKRCLND